MGGIILIIAIVGIGYVLFWSLKRDTLSSKHTDPSYLGVKDLSTKTQKKRRKYGTKNKKMDMDA